MDKSLLIGQVASLARDIETSKVNLSDFGLHVDRYVVDEESDDDQSDASGVLDGVKFSSRRVRINELLGEWEEPPETIQTVSFACVRHSPTKLEFLTSLSVSLVPTGQSRYWGYHPVS